MYGSEFTVDNGLRRVKTGFWPTPSGEPGGSGITEIDHLTRKNLSVTIHEFAHYLLGGNEMHSGYGAWAMLDDWGKKSKVANSFERYRLGWINVNTVDTVTTQTISSATLPDYVTTGIAYRLHINSSEGFYLENHQKLSYWENNNSFGVYGTSMVFGNIENGIYVFRQGGLYGNQLSILPADGRYNWVVNQFVANPWGNSPDSLPVFKIVSADRVNGFHDLEPVQYYWNVQSYIDKIHFTENKFGQPQVDLRFLGDGKDAFSSTNEVFSPYSNPNSQRISKQTTPFGFKVNGFTNGVASIDIYVHQYLNAPPSRPTGLRIGKNSQHQAILEWSPNLEDDMKYNGKYKIYRADSNDGNEPSAFSLLATINAYNGTTPVNTFTDTDVFVGNGQAKLYYKISAVDNSNLESAMSLSDWINWDRNVQKSNEVIRITEFKLYDNFPKPIQPKHQDQLAVASRQLANTKSL